MQRKPLASSTTDFISLLSNGLLNTCQRSIVISKTEKRHGSSVPGPMECRRRLGRRRMTHVSDATQPATHFFAALWGFAGEVDRTRWKWEAPTPRQHTSKEAGAWSSEAEVYSRHPTKTEERACLPQADEHSWSSHSQSLERLTYSYYRSSLTKEVSLEQASSIAGRAASLAQFEKSLRHLQSMITSDTQQWQINQGTNAFVRCLEDTLALRGVENWRLANTLESLRRDLRHRSRRLQISSTKRRRWEEQFMHPIHYAIWRRATRSDSWWPITNTIKILFPSMLPFVGHPKTQILAAKMSASLTKDRLEYVLPELGLFISEWIWIHDKNWRMHMAAVGPALMKSDAMLRRAHEQIYTVGQQTEGAVTFDPRCSLRRVRYTVHRAKRIVASACLKIQAYEGSMSQLSKLLREVPNSSLSKVFDVCLEANKAETASFNSRLLSMVATMKSVDDALFLELLVHLCPSMKVEDDIFIDHLISQGCFRQMELGDRKSLKACISTTGSTTRRLASLISSSNNCQSGTASHSSFLAMLLISRGHKSILSTLRGMLKLGLVVKHSLLTPLLAELVRQDSFVAWKAFCAFQAAPRSCGVDGCYSLANCPELLIAVINQPRFPLHLFWEALEREDSLKMPLNPHLPSRRSFICKIAWILARSETRSNRVIIRNLTRCVTYFYRHRLRIPSPLALALGHVSINRKVKDGRWVGQQPTRWVLGLLIATKNKQVAQGLADVSTAWRQHNRVYTWQKVVQKYKEWRRT